MKPFQAPQESLGDLDAATAARLLGLASDVLLILDEDGTIRDASLGEDVSSLDRDSRWIGRRWEDVVTVESREKVRELMADAAVPGPPRWRQVNHPLERAADIPVTYTVIVLPLSGRRLAVGRDMQPVAAIQQRLIEAQQSLEREYWQLRHAEARYRLLFQTSREPILLVDADGRRILEANAAASRLIGSGKRELIGQTFPDGFDSEGQEDINALLDLVTAVGKADDIVARRQDGSTFQVSASLLRHQTEALLLLRLTPRAAQRGNGHDHPGDTPTLPRMVDLAPDAMVMTDAHGRVINVNRAFLDLAELPNEREAHGESLSRWLGKHGVDLEVMLANLRQHGSVRLFPSVIRGLLGSSARVEVSATTMGSVTTPRYGFYIRHIDHRPSVEAEAEMDQPRSVEQMTQLVGQVPLKELVRESTDLIEKLCIEAALQLTGDNRASAAELLGLSRQSLYVKLRRHGLMDGDSSDV